MPKAPAFFFGGNYKHHGDEHGDGHDHHEINRDRIVLRDEKSGKYNKYLGYYLNPNEAARRMMRVVAQFDKV